MLRSAPGRVIGSSLTTTAPDVWPSSRKAVVNSRRPFNGTADAVVRVIADIEAASGMRIGKLVVNSHLIDQTDRAVIEEGIRLAEEVTRNTAASIAFVAVERRILKCFDAEGCGYPVMVLDRMMLKPWENSGSLGSDRFRH